MVLLARFLRLVFKRSLGYAVLLSLPTRIGLIIRVSLVKLSIIGFKPSRSDEPGTSECVFAKMNNLIRREGEEPS